jgi:hypothetical protein
MAFSSEAGISKPEMLDRRGRRRCISEAPLYSVTMLSRRVTIMAIVLSLVALAIWMALPSEIDSCLDSGGRWTGTTCER